MKKQILSEEFERMKKIAGVNELNNSSTEVYVLGGVGERSEDLIFNGVYTKTGLLKSNLVPVGMGWDEMISKLNTMNNFYSFDFIDKTEHALTPEEENIVMSKEGINWVETEFDENEGARMHQIAKVNVVN